MDTPGLSDFMRLLLHLGTDLHVHVRSVDQGNQPCPEKKHKHQNDF